MKNKIEKEELGNILADKYTYVKRILAVKGASADMQEEIAQETIFEAYKRIDKLRDMDKLNAWLATVARRLFIKECKRKRMFMYDNDNIYTGEFIENISFTESDVLDEIVRIEDRKYLLNLINRLDYRNSSIIILRYMDDMSFKDIALAMDMNYSTVRSLHNRALAKLKRLMEGEKGEVDYGKQR